MCMASLPEGAKWDQYCVTDGFVAKSSPMEALFLCRCDADDQEFGNSLQFVAGCNKCLNIAPDHRAHCDQACASSTVGVL